MITEDYVSFETANLLKEKGFPQDPHVCNTVYTSKGNLSNNAKSFVRNAETFTECGVKPLQYSMAPTLQTAMKWLREVHNIMVSPYALSLGYYFEIFDLTTRDITGCKPLYQLGIPSKEHVLSTYEEATEAGIKYTLENLI